MKYVCKIEKDDDFNIENAHSIVLEDNSMFTYTFWEQSYKNVTGKYSNVAIDLLYISLIILVISLIKLFLIPNVLISLIPLIDSFAKEVNTSWLAFLSL